MSSIKFIEENQNDIRDAICPVCGEAVGPAPEICSQCKTPHHWDCWQWSGGCATYACPNKIGQRKPRAQRQVEQPTEKIPFPVLKAGRFLGIFHVSVWTAIWAIGCELGFLYFYLTAHYIVPPVAYLFLSMMVLALFWAGIKSEVYNINVIEKHLTKSMYVLNKEVLEWHVCPLSEVEALVIRDHRNRGQWVRVLAARLSGNYFIELTPQFGYGSEDEQLVMELLKKVHKGTTIAIDRRALPDQIEFSQNKIEFLPK